MSKSKKVEDLWTLVDNEPSDTNDEGDTTTLFVGDSGSGKSTLIQSFLKPTISKEPKPTFALDYNFARKKASSNSSSSGKSVAHIWELGGDISEPKLLEVPLTVQNLATSAVVICCDLSKPHNCLASLLKWIKLIRHVVDLRIKALQATDVNAANALKEAAAAPCKEHEKDSRRLVPLEISLYIVANKYDAFKSQSSADRRCLMQVLRFVAHYNCATLITTSNSDATLKECFRSHMTGICFRTSAKVICDAVLEKPVFVTGGKDDFQAILLASHRSLEEGDRAVTTMSTTSGKSRLASIEADCTSYLSPMGLTRDCWNRLGEHVKTVFGATDQAEEKETVEEQYESGSAEKKAENDFPEGDVDDMRAQMDLALARYVAAAERREMLLEKQNQPGAKKEDPKSESKGDDEDERERKPPREREREKKRSSSSTRKS